MILRRAFAPMCSIAMLLFLVLAAAPAFALGVAGADSEVASAPAKEISAEYKPEAEPSAAQTMPRKPAPSYKAEDWTVAIYPLLVWAPVMGGSINLPDLPPVPGAPGGGVSGGDVSGGLESAYFFGFAVQKNWFVADFYAITAKTESRNTDPRIELDTDLLFFDASAGVKVTQDLAVTAGARHLRLGIDAKLGDRATVTWEPNITDPMIGVTWRPSLGKHVGLDIALKGGGFGVGSDYDLSAVGRLDWRIVRNFGLSAGYGVIKFKLSREFTTSRGTFTRETTQTLHGPVFGLAIYF